MLLPDDSCWKHRSLVANGIEQHYVRHGRGPAVVLLHGWPGFWYDWRRLILPVAEFADVIAPDFRGFGETALPSGDPAVVSGQQNLSDDIVALLDGLGIADAILVGYDIGGAIAQHIARTKPDRVAALVLLNPTHPGIGDRRTPVELTGEFWYQHLHRLPWAADLVASSRHTVETYLRHFYDHWAVRHDALTAEEFGAIVDAYARDGAFEASIAWYRARFAERARQAAVPKSDLVVPQPTHVLWSDGDPVSPPDWAADISASFSDLELTRISGAGHFIAWERPDDVVAAIRSQVQAI